jgi:hypothetical protein
MYGGPVEFIYNNDKSKTDSAAVKNNKAVVVKVTLGTDKDPGLKIKDGTLSRLNITISDSIAMFGVKLISKSLTFKYVRDSSQFVMYGGPVEFIYNNDKSKTDSAAVKGNKAVVVKVTLGTDKDPGLKIKDGALSRLNITISDSIAMFGVKLISKSLTFKYVRDSSQFVMYGGPVEFIYNNDKSKTDSAAAKNHSAVVVKVNLGTDKDPGLKIKDGILRHLNITISDTIAMFGIKLNSKSLTFKYDHDSSWFEMYGGPVEFIYNNDSKISDSAAKANSKAIYANVGLGNDKDPGLVIKNGSLQHLNISMSSDMNIFGVHSVIHSLNFEYDKKSSWFKMYGGPVQLIVEKDTIGVSFGGSTKPGLTLQNGQLKSLTLGVSGTFRIKKLSVQPDNLTVSYNQSNQSIIIYNSLKVAIDGQSIQAKLGDSIKPGIEIIKGKLSSLNIAVTSDLKIGGLDFKTKNAGLQYNSDSSYIKLFGSFSVSKLWSASVDIGTQTNPGIVITDGSKLRINGVKLEADDVNLGAVIIEQLMISYSQSSIKAACTLIVSNQFEAGGAIELLYSNGAWIPNKLSLLYQILPPKPGFAMGTTGMFLQGVSGSITNLTDISNFSLTASLMISNGVPFYYGSDKGFLIYNKGTATITTKRLLITDTLLLGAYLHNNKWNSLIGQATASMDLNWAAKSYTISGELKIPTDYGILVNGKISLLPSTMQFYGGVKMRTPSDWWLIGGKEFASIDGCMLINNYNKDKSFAAGWLTIDVWLASYKLGGLYNFGNSSFSSIGGSDIDNIKRQYFNRSSSRASINNHIFSFAIDSSDFGDMIFARISLKEKMRFADVNVAVLGSDEILNPVFYSFVNDTLKSITGFKKINPFSNDTNTIISDLYLNIGESFTASSYNSNWNQSNDAIPKQVDLQKGKYEFIVNVKSDSTPTFEASLIQTNPHFKLHAEYDNDMILFTTHSWLPEIPGKDNDAIVSIFVDTDSLGYDGELISDSLSLSELRNNGIMVHNFNWYPRGFHKNDDFHFYAVLKDSLHAPVYSDYSESFTTTPKITGQIINVDSNGQDSGIANILVYLDLNKNRKIDLNDILATNDTGLVLYPDSARDDIGVRPEPNSISDSSGSFYIDGHFRSDSLLDNGYYTVDFYLERDYEVDPSSPVKKEDVIYLDDNHKDIIIKIRKKSVENN